MNYEQKYKEALGWMQSLYKGLHGVTKEDAEHYFPELKESEDERIKREILELVSIAGNGNQFEEIKDWLEKQGKQNQVSKTDEQSKNPCSGCTNIKGCITCVNGDQRQTSTPKILYSDEVIKWLHGHGFEFKSPDKVIFGFIKDFEL